MSEGHYFQCNGIVLEAKGNGRFIVKIPEMNKNINCTLAGKIKHHSIKIIEGDEVVVDIAVYDPEKGKIVYRKKA
jgi:translation initiation factor IF-1